MEAIRESENFVPDWSLVAEVSGRVVGHVMVSYAELDDGGALVRDVTSRVDRSGEPLVVLEGSPVCYGRFSFEHSVLHGITIDLPDWAPREAVQVLRLTSYDPSLHCSPVCRANS